MSASDISQDCGFRFDNTLIEGDIGDAVYASLLREGMAPARAWEAYKLLAERNPQRAYEEAAMALEGLSIQQVIALTRKIMQSEDSCIRLSDCHVPIPAPNPRHERTVRILRAMGFIIYVISASNDASAKVAASEWFNIPVGNVFGIRSAIYRDKMRYTANTDTSR